MEWRYIRFEDIPSRDEFEQLTLDLLRQGVTNSDRMREEIRQSRKLIFRRVTNNFNEPDGKFVNEHAWVLESLMVRKVIEKIQKMEYRLRA